MFTIASVVPALRLAAAALLLCALGGEALAARRALVIGNDAYQSVERLRNASADARAIADALRLSGFEVRLHLDVGEKGLKQAVRDFKALVRADDEVVFYFSGHGVQLAGTNYLLPVDIRGDSEEQVRDEALSLQRVLDDMQDQKARFALAIIDACRNNPFVSSRRSLGGRGLAPTNPASGQMVMFAAGTGQTALDRLGSGDGDRNGVFTRVLLKKMREPAMPADRMLKEVRMEVIALAKSVRHEQVPAIYDQSIGDFYFQPGAVAAPAVAVPPPSAAKPQQVAVVPPSAPAAQAESGEITFAWPVAGRILKGFDKESNKGLDLDGRRGEEVRAAAGGRVVYAGGGLRGYGNMVLIKHDNTYLTAYAHNDQILVKEEEVVRKGQVIARMGSSEASRVMLHFQVRREGSPVDPLSYLPSR